MEESVERKTNESELIGRNQGYQRNRDKKIKYWVGKCQIGNNLGWWRKERIVEGDIQGKIEA